MTVNNSILRFYKIEIYYTPIQSFWTNIPRHVADKGHSGMPCVHVVSIYLPHMRLVPFDSLCNLLSLYINIVKILSYLFFVCYFILIYLCVESFLVTICLLKGFFFTYSITFTYPMCIHYLFILYK